MMILLQAYSVNGVLMRDSPSWLLYYTYMVGCILFVLLLGAVYIGYQLWYHWQKPLEERLREQDEEILVMRTEKSKDEEYKDLRIESATWKGTGIGLLKFQDKIFSYMEGAAKAVVLERTSEMSFMEIENLRRQILSAETEIAEKNALMSRSESIMIEMRNEAAKQKHKGLEYREQGRDLLDTCLVLLAQAQQAGLPAAKITEIQIGAENFARDLGLQLKPTALPSLPSPQPLNQRSPVSSPVSSSVSSAINLEKRQNKGNGSVSHPNQVLETEFKTEVKFTALKGMEVVDRGGYALIAYKKQEFILPYDNLVAGVPYRLCNEPQLFATLCGHCARRIKVTWKEAKYCSEKCKTEKHNNQR